MENKIIKRILLIINQIRTLRFFSKNKNSYSKIDQLRYLSQSALIEESASPHIVRVTLMIISIIILSLVLWAGLTQVNEIAITEGEVVPSKHVQSIQHLEGGTVSDIHVSEGELVQKNQILITLNGTGFKKDFAALKAKKIYLQYKQLRLKAFINKTTPNFDEILDGKNQNIEEEEMNSFKSMVTSQESDEKVINEQITQKEESLEILEQKKTTLVQNLVLVNQERDLKKELMEKGNISKFNYLGIQKEFNQIKGDLISVDSEIDQAKNAIIEYKNRLKSLSSRAIDSSYQELNQVNTDIAQIDQGMQKLADIINHLNIRSPSYGYIKGLKVKTIGGVVEAGNVIAEIVPLEGPLVIETKIQPKDVGNIKYGQQVIVKVSSYDYARYGAVQGKLQEVSATTFVNPDGTRYYLGKVSLEKNYVGRDHSKNIIIPGMTVQADIVTGSKSILSYLLKPIRNSITTAFTER